MKIALIEKIKLYSEKRKLRKMSDGALIKQLEEKIMAEETGNIPNIVGYVEDDDKQLHVAKELIESQDINIATKKQVIEKLPQQTQKELFRKSIKTKELLAQKDINTFLKIIIKDKKLQPYDELYYRVDKAFSDSQLSFMLRELKRKRPESYSEEKVMEIVAKQIIVNMKKYGTFLPSHLPELLDEITINSEQGKQRKFDILEENDKEKITETLKRVAEEVKENKKVPITETQKQNIEEGKIDIQIARMVRFAEERQEQLREQGIENDRKNGYNR